MKRKDKDKREATRDVIMALCESKGKEIGMCWIECNTNVIEMCQFLDTNTYIQTLILVNIFSPSQILISKTQEKSELTQTLQTNGRKVSFLPRSSFNENDGLTLAERIFTGESGIIIKDHIAKKYLCAASFNALMQKMAKFSFLLQPGVMCGKYHPLSDKVRIDVQTAQQLELVTNVVDGKNNNTLFSAINNTLTTCGRRYLIDNILQPPSDVETIVERQCAVEYFLKNSSDYYRFVEFLKQVPDIDKIVMSILQLSRTESIRHSTQQTVIRNVCGLQRLVNYIPQLKESLKNFSESHLLFSAMSSVLNDPLVDSLKLLLESLLDEDMFYSKNQNRVCFVIKSDTNPYLDVSRQIMMETLKEINDVASVEESNGLILKSSQNGFHYVFNGPKEAIPERCTRVITLGKNKFSLTTPELLSLSNRYMSTKEEIVKISVSVLSEKSESFKSYIGLLNRIAETIGLLDMIISFATYASVNPIMCKPLFNDTRTIVIRQGRHPVIQTMVKNFVPNDTYIDEVSRFCLINGPNMGGKSTYIRQIALLTILAHMGSLIPAEAASFRPFTGILSRLSIDDSLESNQSSFMKEMKEMKEILELKTDQSLILIDELGRGTSVMDGVSLAWSISEEIITQSKATCLFVSHFSELGSLEKLYPQAVREYHMEVLLENGFLHPTYLLAEGFNNDNYYGIQIAETAGFPHELIEDAINIKSKRKEEKDRDINTAKYDLGQKLLALKDSHLDQTNLRAYLKYLKQIYFEE